jgi:hypothetical protein
VTGIFGRMFGAEPVESPQPMAMDDSDSRLGPVRFRPRLIAELTQAHETSRVAMRVVLDACRRRDEDAQIIGLQRFAATYRHLCIAKSIQLYPYLRWALEQDRLATIQFKAVLAELQRSVRGIESLLDDYLSAPWLNERRHRFMIDVASIAHRLGPALQQEEANIFPFYLPPGQYRYVHAPALP